MLESLFSFESMIVPKIIRIINFLGIIASVLLGLLVVIGGGVSLVTTMDGESGIIFMLLGLLLTVFGPICVRIYCELLIVLFNIYDKLCIISKNTTYNEA